MSKQDKNETNLSEWFFIIFLLSNLFILKANFNLWEGAKWMVGTCKLDRNIRADWLHQQMVNPNSKTLPKLQESKRQANFWINFSKHFLTTFWGNLKTIERFSFTSILALSYRLRYSCINILFLNIIFTIIIIIRMMKICTNI